MNLFNNTFSNLDSILKNRSASLYSKYDPLSTTMANEGLGSIEKGLVKTDSDKVLVKADYTDLQNLFGKHKFSFTEPTIGPHPDFAYLGHNQYLNHYAVSMFLDIKGSTLLSKKYSLLQIRQIKDTILSLAIQVCSFFGGHIQRLQGDGIFVYFVRKDLAHNDAIINSLNASAMISYFMKYSLPKFFESDEIITPKVRIGVDYGNADQTIWSYYGLPYCNELTTTGLHTDLAAKLQAKAKPNGILLGNNIIEELDLQTNLVSNDDDDKHIFDNSYKKWELNWETYLKTFDFFKNDSQGKLIIEVPETRLKCEIASDENSPYIYYPQNLYSIPKGYKLKFSLIRKDGSPYIQKSINEQLRWSIKNTGKEATKANAVIQNVDKSDNKHSCYVDARYLGHHDMQCKLIVPGLTNKNLRFPVFIR